MNFTEKMEKYLVPLATKLSANKYLIALRDSFAFLVPFVITGSMFGLLSWVVLDPSGTVMGDVGLNVGHLITGLSGKAYLASGFVAALNKLVYMCNAVITGSFSVIALMLTLSLSMKVGELNNADPKMSGLIGLCSYLILLPQSIVHTLANGKKVTVASAYSVTNFSSSAIVTAIIVSFLFVGLFTKLQRSKKLRITLPESVPPAVSESFSSLLPIALTLSLAGVICGALNWLGLPSLNDLIYNIIQAPLTGFSQGLGFGILYVFIQQILWWFGIHGGNITSPIEGAVYLPAQVANMTDNAHYIFTSSFFGAIGCHNLGLLIAIFVFSKKADWRAIGKLAIGPTIFNIGEPLMFGLPIMLNPILLIPSVLAPIVNVTIGYLMMSFNLAPVFKFSVPWTVPAVLNGALGTGSISGGIMQALYVLGSFLVYAPFVIINNKINLNKK